MAKRGYREAVSLFETLKANSVNLDSNVDGDNDENNSTDENLAGTNEGSNNGANDGANNVAIDGANGGSNHGANDVAMDVAMDVYNNEIPRGSRMNVGWIPDDLLTNVFSRFSRKDVFPDGIHVFSG